MAQSPATATLPSETPPPAGSDNLSRLNDDVLHHILSFAPDTEHRARTSLLSSRFRHLWAEHESIRVGFTDTDTDTARFSLSVSRIISSFRPPVLLSLELCLHDAASADRLVRFAAARSVANLRILSPRNARIPRAVLDCRNLRSLYVNACALGATRYDFPGFPFLASVRICCSNITAEELASLLGKCPALRSLSLASCDALAALDIASSTLAELTVFECEGLEFVRVDAPRLASVSFKGDADGLFLKDVARLSSVTVHHTGSGGGAGARAEWERKVMGLCSASERMRMDGWLFRFVLRASPARSFESLKKLTCRVEWVTAPVLRGLVVILENSRNLEHLGIDLWCGTRKSVLLLKEEQMRWLNLVQDDRERPVWDPSESGGALCRALKSVVVTGFMGTANEMKMMEYLLGRGVALEKFTLAKCLVSDTELVSLARATPASPHVRIQIHPVKEVY